MNRRVTLAIFAIALGAFLTHAAPAVGQTSGKDATQKTSEAADAIKGGPDHVRRVELDGLLEGGAVGLPQRF